MGLNSLLAQATTDGDSGWDLLRLRLTREFSFELSVHWLVLLIIAVAILAAVIGLWSRGRRYDVVELNVDVAKIGKVVMRPNQEVAGIAHRAWSELTTRKAALPFDPDRDVIAEVYDSWHSLFGEMRSLIRAIPVEKLRASPDAQKLCDYLVRVLNDVLRPHLTQHQARFRSWYEHALKDNPGKSPQDLQRSYPGYDELVRDLIERNRQMVDFAAFLKQVAYGEKT